MPAGLVRSTFMESWPAPTLATDMLLQSVAGLAAQAVNEGRGDELVWVAAKDGDWELWLERFLTENPRVELRGTLDPWALVERFRDRGVIKGYILYRLDTAKPDPKHKFRPGMDLSANVATSLAGLLGGVMVDESLESQAKQLGLPLLADARDKTQQWCFDTYKEQFSRQMLLAMDPKMSAPRDYAIAHRAFSVFTYEEPLPAALAWVEAPAPILGWIGGDEFQATRLATIHGHFQTATSKCRNLPVLMAGAHERQTKQLPHFDPRTIDWLDDRSTVTVTISDGDNVLYSAAGFFNRDYYWKNPERGRIPFGWSLPLAHLVQICPQPIDYAIETRTPNDWVIEWQGGYYYPDLFATERPDRWAVLAKHARRVWQNMQLSGSNMIAFNVRDYDSPDALKAYETFAAQTDGLLAMLVFQYSPYNAGAGRVLWVKDARGIEVPVITLRYQIWHHLNRRANAGTPAKVAREIRETADAEEPGTGGRSDWAMIQTWSFFKPSPGDDEEAENLPPKKQIPAGTSAEDLGGVRGYSPALWMTDRLPERVRVVSPEEMAWRIRMQHDPETTRRLIEAFSPTS